MNNINNVEPVDDHFQNFLDDKEYYRKKLSDFSSNLKVEQNINIYILNTNKKDKKIFKLQKESFCILKKITYNRINQIRNMQRRIKNNKFNIEKNNRIQLYYNIKFNNDNLNEIKNNEIQLNYNNKFNIEEFNEINNNQIQLNYEFKKFDENKFGINKANEINIKPVNIKDNYKYRNNIYSKLRKKNNLCDNGTNPIKEININVINKENEIEILSQNPLENKLNKNKKIFEIINNDLFCISSDLNKNKKFKDYKDFKIINNTKIFYKCKKDNIKTKKRLKISRNNQFNIIKTKENSKNKTNLLNIDNYNLYISSIPKKLLFNENILQNENNINLSLIKNKKIPPRLSINNEFFNYDIDLINKNKNRINEFNKNSFITNNIDFNYIPYKNKNIIFEKINIDNINYTQNDENKENKDSNIAPKKYIHIIDEINTDFPSKLNMNNKLNKNKNSILSKIKKNGLDIKINKLDNKNISLNSSVSNSFIISDIAKNENEENGENGEKGEIIEQNIDRLLNQNKALYLQNLINQKKEKEKEISKILNNNNLLLKYYFLKWKTEDDKYNFYRINNIKRYKNKNLSNEDKLKNIFRKYTIRNWNKDIKKFIDKYLENPVNKKKPYNINEYNTLINDDLDELPDLDYIRNKLHVSVVKRIKITEEEINKFKQCFNILNSVIKKHIYKFFIKQYRNE